MTLDELLDRRQKELGKRPEKPESIVTRWLANIDWENVASIICGVGLIFGLALYSASVLLPVLVK